MSLTQQCGNCHVHTNPIQDAEHVICANCGAIMDENNLEHEIEYAKKSDDSFVRLGRMVNADNMHHVMKTKSLSKGTKRIQYLTQKQYKHNRFQRKLSDTAKSKADELGLGARYNDEIAQLMQQCIGDKITHKSKTSLWLAAIFYIVVRNHQLCYTMLDIATLFHLPDIYCLARAYKKFVVEHSFVLPPVNPTVLVDRLVHLLLEEYELNSNFHLQLVKLSKMLVEIMKKQEVHAGRRPSSLVAAAVKFIAANLGRKFSYNDLHRALGFGGTATRQRFKEIKEYITTNAKKVPLIGKTLQTPEDLATKIVTVIQYLYVRTGANQQAAVQPTQQQQQTKQSVLDDAFEVLDDIEWDETAFEGVSLDGDADLESLDLEGPLDNSTIPAPETVQEESSVPVYSSDEEQEERLKARQHVVEISDSESDDDDLTQQWNRHGVQRTPRGVIHPPSFQTKLSDEEIQRRLVLQVQKFLRMDMSIDVELKKELGRTKFSEEVKRMTQHMFVQGEKPENILQCHVTVGAEVSGRDELKSLLFDPLGEDDMNDFKHLIYSDRESRQKRILAGLILQETREQGLDRERKRRKLARNDE